jgi:hypothetical protein
MPLGDAAEAEAGAGILDAVGWRAEGEGRVCRLAVGCP